MLLSIAGRGLYPKPKQDETMNMRTNSGQLSVPLSASIPTDVELFSILRQVEVEMAGKPLTAETAFTFMEEVKRRFADLIVIEAG